MTKDLSLLEDLQNALKRLKEAISEPETQMNKDATIQRFEFTFELAWKLMQFILSEENVNSYGPKNAIREAAKFGLIESAENWLEFAKMRNLATHTYNQELADKVYASCKGFPPQVEKFINKVKLNQD